MAIIKNKFDIYSYEIRKKLNIVSDADRTILGLPENLSKSLLPGIYKAWRRFGKFTNWRCKFYTPANPQTEKQQAHRAIYGAGVEAWRDLSVEQKKEYNIRAYGKHMSGYNLFMKEYLKSH